MISTTRRFAAAAILTASAAGLVVGCGDDDDSASDTTTTEAAADTSTTAGSGLAATCSAYVDITMALNSDGPPDPAAIQSLVETIEQEAPDDIAGPLGVMTAAVDSVLESGGEDFSAFESEEFVAAQGEVDPYVLENCEFDATFEVSAKDYSFEGIPDEVPAGKVAMLLTNEGAEAHEIIVVRKMDGVTESFADLLELPEEETEGKIEMVGATFAPSNGSTGLLVGDFEPGEYLAVCFVPTGTTIDDSGEHEGDGPPHFMEGMQQEFTVAS